MDLKNMTGFEFLKAIADGVLPASPMAQIIPMQLANVEKGRVQFIAKADSCHRNPIGGVHGGFAATVLDSATGCAVHSVLEAGVGYATVDLNVKMVRPIPENKELFADGKIINVSKNIGVSEGEIRDAEGKLYAHATCICMIIRSSNT